VVPRTEHVLGILRRWEETGFDRAADCLPVLADALEEGGYEDAKTLATMRNGGRGYLDAEEFYNALRGVPDPLNGYDWRNVFAYAGETPGEVGGSCDGSANISNVFKAADHLPGVSPAPFNRWDVVRLIAVQDGGNDGPDWVAVGELRDGRFFAIRAGCDYTGWG
jgi:hypothetical protein